MAKIKTHEVKISPEYFEDIARGDMSFISCGYESFRPGDIVTFLEFNENRGGYTGRYINTEITYVIDDPEYCKDHYVMFSFRKRLNRGVVI